VITNSVFIASLRSEETEVSLYNTSYVAFEMLSGRRTGTEQSNRVETGIN